MRFEHWIVYPAACLAPAGSGTHRRRAGGRDHGIDDRARDRILALPDKARVDPLNRIGATGAITNFPIYHLAAAGGGKAKLRSFVTGASTPPVLRAMRRA